MDYGYKKWWFYSGGWAKSKWIRISGLMIGISFWKILPFEFNISVDYQKIKRKVIGIKQHSFRIG